jgi:hypothetical protein
MADELRLSPRVAADEVAREWLTSLVGLCDEVNTRLHAWGREARWIETVTGSPRDYDVMAVSRKYGPAGPWTTEPIDRALHTSIIHLGVAVQHLAGIRELLASGEVIFPVAPIVRSSVEICGRVIWTMAPNTQLETRERVARMLLIEIDDVTHAKTLAKKLGLEREVTRYGDALYELRKVRLPAFFFPSEIDRNAGGGLVVRKQRIPGLDGFVATMETPGLYTALSAATHPTLLLMMQAVDRTAMAANPCDPTASVPLTFRLHDIAPIATLVRNAALAIIRAWKVLAAYQGIDFADLDDLQDEIASLSSKPS